jgi:hypothetical protein
MDAHVHHGRRIGPGERSAEVAGECAARERLHGGCGICDRSRVGRIRGEQQLRRFAAQQAAREIGGNHEYELHFVFGDQALDLGITRITRLLRLIASGE